MQFSSKKIRELSYLVFFSSFSFLFLLFFWYVNFYNKEIVGVFFNQLPILLYYIFFILLFSLTGFSLYKNDRNKFLVIFSFLFLFLLSSLFITTGAGWAFLRTLFFSTFYLIMASGGLLGGPIFLSFFSIIFIFEFFLFFFFLKEKFDWFKKDTIKIPHVSFLDRNLFNQFVPLVAFFSYSFNFENSYKKSKEFFDFLTTSDLALYLPLVEKIKTIFLNALPLFLGLFVLVSVFVRNKKMYFILNIILLVLLISPYLYVWIFLK